MHARMPISSIKTEKLLEKAFEKVNRTDTKLSEVLWLQNESKTEIDGTHSLRRMKKRIQKEVERKEERYHLKH